ncbi:ATP-dependent RecD-like DNA helicase [soil metagenome]
MARPTYQASPDASLSGEVAAVVFANPDSGFGVIELTGDDEADGARAAGPLAALVAGQPVKLSGRWTDHERYGPTFAADAYELERPQSTAGLVTFLSSERFPGVGITLARRLAKRFGLAIGEVIATCPERLAQTPGVSAALAERIAGGWAEAGALATLVRRLSAAGLPATVAQAVHRQLGDTALAVVDADPYALLSVRGVRWDHAERLGKEAGIGHLDPRRLAAGAVVAHRQLTSSRGHVALTDADLLAESSRVLHVAALDARDGIDRAAARRDLVLTQPPGASERCWYLPGDLAAEEGLAAELARLAAAASRVAGPGGDADLDPALTDEQAEGVRAALTRPISVLTGGPGTGKTRTVCELVRVCAQADLRLALCAPTGRAAKRLEEVTGHGATTVHRLLEAHPSKGGGFAFGYDADRRLPQDVVVADEWSMADLRLAWALVQAVGDGAHLVLVGDADQLPSVGAGAVLRDLLDPALGPDGADVVASTRLTRIHRQAASSRIVTLAHQINAGAVPELSGRDGDVFVVPERPAGVAARVAEIVAVRAPRFYGLPSTEVQVLAPMYRGPAGVDALNAAIKQRVNPADGRAAVAGFNEGDRVLQTRNDAELDVANGDIGEVVAVHKRERALSVAFSHGVVDYGPDRTDDLRPAWALTVHKAQGGEWPVVVLICDPTHRHMLWRELVYTAVSRAARGLLLVGDARLVAAAAARTGSGARERRTHLTARLAATAAGMGDTRGARGTEQLLR